MKSLKQLQRPLERFFNSHEDMLNSLERERSKLNEKLARLQDVDDAKAQHEREQLEEKLRKMKIERQRLAEIKKGVTQVDRTYRNLLEMKSKEFRTAMEALADEVRQRKERERAHKHEDIYQRPGEGGLGETDRTEELRQKGHELKRELTNPCGVCNEDLRDVNAAGFRCECGQVFHDMCAADIEECLRCTRPLKKPISEKKKTLKVECPSCGEVVSVEDDANLLKANCESCGSILQEVAEGYNYLIVDDDPGIAYSEFKTILKKGIPGLCLSTTYPDKLVEEFDISDADLYWLSDTATVTDIRTLDPKRLDFETIRVIGKFIKNFPKGVIILDGLEYLLVENGFKKALRFMKKVNDLASVSKATVLVPLDPSSLGRDEFARFRKEFDKVQIVASEPLSR